MKILLHMLLLSVFFTGISFADEIYMNDLRVIKGKIIQVTDKNVEFSQEGKPLLIVPRDQVFKIRYDDGQEVQIADLKGQDKIYLKDGSVVQGTIVKVTPDVIIYSATDKQEAAVRDNVVKIEYADGKVIQLSEGQITAQPAQTSDQQAQQQEPDPAVRSGGFIDSNIWFNFYVGFSGVSGTLEERENDKYKENESNFSDKDNPYLINSGGHTGFELNLMFPSIKYKQTRAFDLTGVKFGLKTTYVFSEIYEEIREEDNDWEGYDTVSEGTLLKYRSVNAGPEVNFIFSPRTETFNMVVQLYAMGGYIHNGKLTAAPALRDEDETIISEQYKAEFTGYSVTVGAGSYLTFNTTFPVTIGYSFFYTYSKIKFNRDVEIYNGANNASFKEVGYTLSVGVHI